MMPCSMALIRHSLRLGQGTAIVAMAGLTYGAIETSSQGFGSRGDYVPWEEANADLGLR